MIRTVQLCATSPMPRCGGRVTAATNKVEAFDGFSQWLGFGNRGVIADNDPSSRRRR